MEKSKEEYLKLLGNRQIKENDLPKELLSDEGFVRQAYKIDKFIVYSADTEISANIFREEVKTTPYIFGQFPKKVLLMCEEECVKAIIQHANDYLIKSCPKEILINNPDLCAHLLEEGISPDIFPEEILSRYPSDYIEDLKTKAQANKKTEKIQTIPRPVRRNRDTQNRAKGVNKGVSTKGGKIYPKEVLLSNPELTRRLLKAGTPLENIPRKCQILFKDLCIEHLKDGDYESNFKHLADEIKVKRVDICIEALKNLNKVENNGDMQKNRDVYGYIPNELYSDMNFIKSVARFDDEIFEHIPKENYSNLEFIQTLFQINKRVVGYVDSQFLLSHSELTRKLLKSGAPLECIPKECQLKFPELCIEHLKDDGNYESNFKHLADEIKVKHVDVCVAAIKRLNKVKKNGHLQKNTAIYGYIPNKLYSNMSFIKSVAEFDDEIFEHIPKENYSNVEFVQELFKVNKRVVRYVDSQILISIVPFIKSVSEFDDEIWDHIPRENYSNAEFVQELFKVNKRVARYVDSQMLKKLMNQDEIKIGAEWQEECLSAIKDEQNIILSSPTGSGKTRVFLEWARQKQERPIYITAPIKALSNQRWRELNEQGFIVGIETGDVKNVPENCDFICCTQEIYTNKYVEQENVTLIMDEFHFIFEDSSRARTYIEALHDAKAKNILLCSATFGDVNKLNQYINKVSGREFYAYENHSRLTELSFEGHIDKDRIRNALVVAFTPENCKSICNSIKASREEKDEGDIKQIIEIAQKYGVDENELMEYVKFGVAYYYGKMLPKEKLFLEELFEKKLIDSLSGTDALAMGVNFPIQNVVFAQLAKNVLGPINKNLFDQLVGRAGRKGFFDEGFIYYCDNFIDSKGRMLELNGYNTAELYYELLFSENKRSSVRLKPKIKDILLGKTTIEEEAQFIITYSEGLDYSLKVVRDEIEKK